MAVQFEARPAPDPRWEGRFSGPLFSRGDLAVDGQYEIQAPLGVGDYTQVYRAIDLNDGTDVALKVLADNDDFKHQAEVTVKAHERLDDEPAVVPLHDAGSFKRGGHKIPYLASEFVEGGTLRQQMREHPRDIEMILSMASSILPGLGTMHARGVVHRDVTPNNILGDTQHGFQLNDLGIAEVDQEIIPVRAPLSDKADTGEAATSLSIGATLGYLAPERLDGGLRPAKPAEDVFAFGVVLFEGLTGEKPFQFEESTKEDLHRGWRTYRASVLEESPASIESLNRSVPAELGMLTMRCLSPDPADRPPVIKLAPAIDQIKASLQIERQAALERFAPA